MAKFQVQTSLGKRQEHSSEQQQCAFDRLPEHIVAIITQHLTGGSLENFRASCQRFKHAAGLLTKSLDFHDICWAGDTSAQVPGCAVAALEQHPNVTRLIIPSTWRRTVILESLQHMAHSKTSAVSDSGVLTASNSSSSSFSSSGCGTSVSGHVRLKCLELHFQSICAQLCQELAVLAPGITRLELSLDLAFELTTKQANRIAALAHLPNLTSLSLDPDVGPEALNSLAKLPHLRDLTLSGGNHVSHSGRSLKSLCDLSSLTGLTFKWTAGRTMADASPLTRMTNLRRLHVWLGASSELPPCSNKPLRGLLAAVGQLWQLTELQMLKGLYLSWELHKIVQLDALTKLQVLSLHDSVLTEEGLSLLAPCLALTDLRVDTIRLSAQGNTAGTTAAAAAAAAAAATAASAAAAAAAAAAVAAASGVQGLVLPQPPMGDYAYAAAAMAAPAILAAAGAAVEPPAAANAHQQPSQELYRRLALAMVTLARLQQLQCNMLHLGLYRLPDMCPQLTHLSPLADALAPGGHGVGWNLAAIEGHPTLQTLGLMLGALGSTCSYVRMESSTHTSARALAASVMRSLLQSAGLGGMRAASIGVTHHQVLQVLQSLPSLQQLSLWGHAGGLGGKALISVTADILDEQVNQRHAAHCSSTNRVDRSVQRVPGDTCAAASMGATFGEFLCAFGSLLTPTDLFHLYRSSTCQSLLAAECQDGTVSANSSSSSSSSSSCGDYGGCSDRASRCPSCLGKNGGSSSSSMSSVTTGELLDRGANAHSTSHSSSSSSSSRSSSNISCGLEHCDASAAGIGLAVGQRGPDAVKQRGKDQDRPSQQQQQQQQQQLDSLLSAGPHNRTPGTPVVHQAAVVSPDEVFVVQLLKGLPRLQLLQLYRCRHLQGEGQGLAQHCCGRYSPASVTYQ